MLDIRNRLVQMWHTRRKRDLQNEKFLPTVLLEATTSRLLDWHSNKIRHVGKNFFFILEYLLSLCADHSFTRQLQMKSSPTYPVLAGKFYLFIGSL